ncbi:MAG: formylmethanofuran dehydrogenase subunit E family protein [Candidatus Korarchaeum sp.]|nr:formylmethanofuran dehydrogenase subunit E family protein [Candidatus Korarchaeum sp.]MDW8035188.1 FmdE family protein [Candidatus Korarchaeum sp.]
MPAKTPYTCSVDEVQASTGCTMGKMSIRIEEQDSIESLLLNKRKGLILRLKLREGIPELIERISSKKGVLSASS